jgi:predicted transposase YdaD
MGWKSHWGKKKGRKEGRKEGRKRGRVKRLKLRLILLFLTDILLLLSNNLTLPHFIRILSRSMREYIQGFGV